MKLFVPGRICLFGEHSDWAGGYRRINADLELGYTLITGNVPTAFTTPPAATAPLKTLNGLDRNSSVKSASSIPNRVSGLSMPNRFSASSKRSRGNGVGMSIPSATFQTRFRRPSIRA